MLTVVRNLGNCVKPDFSDLFFHIISYGPFLFIKTTIFLQKFNDLIYEVIFSFLKTLCPMATKQFYSELQQSSDLILQVFQSTE